MHASEYTYQSECEMSMCGRELANERTSQTLENSDDTQQVLVTESVDAEDRHGDERNKRENAGSQAHHQSDGPPFGGVDLAEGEVRVARCGELAGLIETESV